MESGLFILTCAALALLALALVLWMVLLGYRLVDNRQRARRVVMADEWLLKLLPVLEMETSVTSLPKVRGGNEMEAVLSLLRDLMERFRGQYRDQLREILVHIGGADFGLRLLRQRHVTSRLRGCALLGWTGESPAVNAALRLALQDEAKEVRMEAAYALALRGPTGLGVREVLESLEEKDALASDRLRDVVRMLAPGRSQELARLLPGAATPRLRVLLLDGLSAAGDLAHSDLIATQLQDAAPAVRAAAVLALERLGDPMQISRVGLLAQDPSPKVRLAAAHYLVSMGPDTEALQWLENLVLDENYEVKRQAVHGLAKVGGRAWQRLRDQPPEDSLVQALIREITSPLLPISTLEATA
ncbi:HEAT repeat domain-containing protein [Prosthecobacter sp. SYSU 5D2]|uniref:HEAT repeat domain-containing protein n=1 Tax=Prosthecobacter sp. SYSU 5D2 TaxID=3134134 RepID=UPI0031FEBF77